MVTTGDQDDERGLLLPDINTRTKTTKCPTLQARHILAIMGFLGTFTVYCLRVGLSVALVAMVNNTSPVSSARPQQMDECPKEANFTRNSTIAATSSSLSRQGEFNWDQKTQGLILGAFYYGYVLTQLPGGWLAERVGGKWLMGGGTLLSSLLTLLTPPTARTGGAFALIALRVLQGLVEGGTYPAMHALWAMWAPVEERSVLSLFTWSGGEIGVTVGMFVAGFLSQAELAGGWPFISYVFGTMGCVWFVMWSLLVHDSPAQHPRISSREQHFIHASQGCVQRSSGTPWRHIVTSPAVWALVVAHFVGAWGYFALMTVLPTYMDRILHFGLMKNGALSGLPFLVLMAGQMTSGFVADYVRGRGYLSTTGARKALNTLGSAVTACCLLAVGYSDCRPALAVTLLMVASLGIGVACSVFMVNHLDIAPRFAGTLMGITNTAGMTPGFLAPNILGFLTDNNQTSAQWRVFFYLSAGIYLCGAAVFLWLGQGEEQPWAASGHRPQMHTSDPGAPVELS